MSGYELLCALPDGCARLAFLDPQYRGIMDAMGYGNEGARQKGRAALPQMTERMIALFVTEIERVLGPSGHMVLWTDKFTVGEGHHLRYFAAAPSLQRVDMGFWNKLRPGMGRRLRNVTEVYVVAQKPPVRAKGFWTDHRINDSWPEMVDRERHAHAKPHQLTERLIRACTKRRDLVVDPCAGSYGVLEACQLSGREFVGCDLV